MQKQKDAICRIRCSQEQSRRIQQVNRLENIFFIIHNHIQNTVMPIIQKDNKSELKKKYLLMMIHNQNINVGRALQRWKQFNQFGKLGDDKKKLFTEMLERFINNSDRMRSIQVLKQFYTNSRVCQIKKNFLNKILDTSAGQKISLFKQWKYLPIITDREEKVQRMKFQLILHNLTQRRLKSFIEPLKNFKEEAEMKKKRAVISLLDKTMSSHKRLFLSWRNSVRQHNQFMKCRRVIEFFEQMNTFISNQSLKFIINSGNQAIVEKVINKMQNNKNQQMRDFLLRWKQAIKWDILNGERYKQILRRMIDSLKSNSNMQLRQALSQFQKNKRIRDIQNAFFKQLFNTKAGQSMTVIKKWKTIPNPNIGPANKFQIILQKFANSRLRELISNIRVHKHEADQKKHSSLQQLISKTMSSNKKFFLEWKNMVSTDRIIRRCQTTITLFERLQEVLIGNTGFIFKSDKDRYLIEKYVNRLISLASSNGLEAIRRWKQVVDIEKMKNDTVKRSMISRMQDNIKNSGKQRLRSTLSQFHKYFRIEKIKHKIFDTLFSTSAGKQLQVFLKWKSLPIPVMVEEKIRAIKFEAALHRLIQRPKKQSYDSFTSFFFDAESKKIFIIKNELNKIQKRFIQNLLNKTMSSHKRMFINWAQMVDNYNKINKCKKTMILFDHLNSVLTERTKLTLFDSVQEYQIKMSAMRKLIDNYQRLRKDFWGLWNQKVGALNHRDQLRGGSISKLQDLLDEKRKRQMGQALQCFDTDKKLQKIAFNLYKKLGSTTNEMVLQVFLKWRYLPYRPPKDNAHQFQEKLVNFANHKNRQFLDALVDERKRAEQKKKNLASELLLRKNGKLRQVFDLWNFNKYDESVQRCSKTMKLFEVIHQKLNQQFAIIAENRNWSLMSKYLEKLIDNQNFNLKYGMKKWQQFVFNDKIDDQMKRRIIQQLNLMKDGSIFGAQRKALNQFMKNRNIKKIQNNFFSMILDTSVGKSLTLFMKWKSLPVIVPTSEKVRAQKFERGLNEISSKRLRTFFNPIKQALTNGLIIKKDILHRLENLTMSDHKKLILRWANDTKQFKQNSKCRFTIDLFANLNERILNKLTIITERKRENQIRRDVFDRIFNEQKTRIQFAFQRWSNLHRTIKQAEKCRKTIEFFDHVQIAIKSKMDLVLLNSNAIQIKTKVLNHLIQISKNNIERAFRKWVQFRKFMDMDDDLKKKMITMLKNAINGSQSNKTREALRSFKKNTSIKKYQQQFFSKLLQLKVGQQMLCFQKWKVLPVPEDPEQRRKVASFQQRMANFFTAPIKSGFDILKDTKYDAELTKKKALFLLMRKTMGIPQKLYIHWKNVTADEKRLELWTKMNKLFENINNKLTSNLENTILERSGTVSQNQKTLKLAMLFEKIQGWHKRMINDGMHMIQRKSSSIVLRAYFASLWKWKFANLDAKYYTKYKQIYRQSAIVSRFVYILSSKITNSLNHGFESIKDSKNKYYKMMSAIRIQEREVVKLQASYINAWRQNMKQQNIQNLMKVITQQKLNRVIQIFTHFLQSNFMNNIKGLVYSNLTKKDKNISNFLLVLHEKGMSAMKRQQQQGLDAILNRACNRRLVIKKLEAVKGLLKFAEFKQRYMQHAFDAIYESSYDQNVNQWEKKTFMQMISLTDLNLSFNILKNLAFPSELPLMQFSPPTQHPSGSNNRNNQGQPPRQNKPQPSTQPAGRNIQSQYQRNAQTQPQINLQSTSSLMIANQLMSSESSIVRVNNEPSQQIVIHHPQQDTQSIEEDNSFGGILNKIGQENLQVINRLGATDHIYHILKTAIDRHKSNILKHFFIKRTVIELRFEQDDRQSQINDLLNTKRKLEGQLSTMERNQKEKEMRIQCLGEELNQALEQSQQILQMNVQKEKEQIENEELIEYLKQQQKQQEQQLLLQQQEKQQLLEEHLNLQQRIAENEQNSDKVKRSSRDDQSHLPMTIANSNQYAQSIPQQVEQQYQQQVVHQQYFQNDDDNDDDGLTQSQELQYMRLQEQNQQISRQLLCRLISTLQNVYHNNMASIFTAYHNTIADDFERASHHQLDQFESEDEQRDHNLLRQVSDANLDFEELENKLQNLLIKNEQAQKEHEEIIEDENYQYADNQANEQGEQQDQNPSQLQLRIHLQYQTPEQQDFRQSYQYQQHPSQFSYSGINEGNYSGRNDGSYSGRQNYSNLYQDGRDSLLEEQDYDENNMEGPLSRLPESQLQAAVDELQLLNSQMHQTLINQLNRKFNDLRTRRFRFAFQKLKNQYYQSN